MLMPGTMATDARTDALPSRRDHIVDVATIRLAREGIRGLTLRAVATDAGIPVATLFAMFGSKEALVAACFEGAIARDKAELAAVLASCRDLELPLSMLAGTLWSLCESASASRANDTLVLVELWLQTQQHPEFRDICRHWICARRDGFRAIGDYYRIDHDTIDIVALIVIAETSFAISCADDSLWRVAARTGLDEAVARLTGCPQGISADVAAAVAARYYSDRDYSDRAGPVAPRPATVRPGKANIIDAASAIIEEQGLAAVTNRAVAARAGMSPASTTYHFHSISDLVFEGVLRLFERTTAAVDRLQPLDGSMASARNRIATRHNPTGVQRVGTRGMTEISLAAARGQVPIEMVRRIRRQRGTITQATLNASGFRNVSRGAVGSHAQWYVAVFLIVAALPDAEALFDFDRQAEHAGRALFGFD